MTELKTYGIIAFNMSNAIERFQPEKSKKLIFPDVPVVFKEGLPKGWRPNPDGWTFTVEKLKEKLPDGTYKILTLDIAINPNEKIVEYVNSAPTLEEMQKRARITSSCPMGCKYCFAEADIKGPLMSWRETKELIKEGKKSGTESVKFLEKAELTLQRNLFEFLDFFEQENIKFLIFTKPVVFGDDELARKFFGLSAEELAHKVTSYKTVRILASFESADKETQETRLKSKIENFADKRNKGIENLCKAGLNSDPNNQRLALICAPVLYDNYDEVLKIIDWASLRNMPVVATPTMVSGLGGFMPEIHDEKFKKEILVKLWSDIYTWGINQGVITLDQLKNEGVSPYVLYACTQFISGMFIRRDGKVQACPGNETEPFIYASDVREEPLLNIWKRSLGYKLREELDRTGELTLTQICYAKTEGELVPEGKGSIPQNFYQMVLDQIENNLRST